jgi:hypothetical protein
MAEQIVQPDRGLHRGLARRRPREDWCRSTVPRCAGSWHCVRNRRRGRRYRSASRHGVNCRDLSRFELPAGCRLPAGSGGCGGSCFHRSPSWQRMKSKMIGGPTRSSVTTCQVPPRSGERRPGAIYLTDTLAFMRVLWALDHSLRSTSKQTQDRLVTRPQRLISSAVGRTSGMMVSQLADLLHSIRSALTAIVARLECPPTCVSEATPERRKYRLEPQRRGSLAGSRDDRFRRGVHPACVEHRRKRSSTQRSGARSRRS